MAKTERFHRRRRTDGAVSIEIFSDRDATATRIAEALGSPTYTLHVTMGHLEVLAAAIRRSRADAVVVAFASPWRATLAALRPRETELDPTPLVAVIPDGPSGIRLTPSALRRGVRGVVTEGRCDRSLPATVLAVSAGQVVAPLTDYEALTVPVLSHRERQVLALVVAGHANSSIARSLYLAESTVKSHLTTIFAKLGVSSRSAAAARVLDPDDPLRTAIMPLVDALDPRAEHASRHALAS